MNQYHVYGTFHCEVVIVEGTIEFDNVLIIACMRQTC